MGRHCYIVEEHPVRHLLGDRLTCSYGRVGLRRQIKVLVRKGVGSNPTVNIAPPSQEGAAPDHPQIYPRP
jgi:hypothetical protein